MSETVDPIALYNERLHNRKCFVRWQDPSVRAHVGLSLKDMFGNEAPALPRTLKVAHGVLHFMGLSGDQFDTDFNLVPWLVAPKAGRRSIGEGRHVYVAQELADTVNVVDGYKAGRTRTVGTYTVKIGDAYHCVSPGFTPYVFKADELTQAAALQKITHLSNEFEQVTFHVNIHYEWLHILQGQVIEPGDTREISYSKT